MTWHMSSKNAHGGPVSASCSKRIRLAIRTAGSIGLPLELRCARDRLEAGNACLIRLLGLKLNYMGTTSATMTNRLPRSSARRRVLNGLSSGAPLRLWIRCRDSGGNQLDRIVGTQSNFRFADDRAEGGHHGEEEKEQKEIEVSRIRFRNCVRDGGLAKAGPFFLPGTVRTPSRPRNLVFRQPSSFTPERSAM
jgi:hypothetical protein